MSRHWNTGEKNITQNKEKLTIKNVINLTYLYMHSTLTYQNWMQEELRGN
jgi:hypothetical protein